MWGEYSRVSFWTKFSDDESFITLKVGLVIAIILLASYGL